MKFRKTFSRKAPRQASVLYQEPELEPFQSSCPDSPRIQEDHRANHLYQNNTSTAYYDNRSDNSNSRRGARHSLCEEPMNTQHADLPDLALSARVGSAVKLLVSDERTI